MNNTVKFGAVSILLAGVAQAALADNRVPPELMATITPAYRTGDMKSTNDTRFVLVRRIEGRDSAGNRQVLFSDHQGALLPVDELAHASKLINPLSIEKKGEYHDLELHLADSLLALDQEGITKQQLPINIASRTALQGKIAVHKYEVIAAGLGLQQPDSLYGKVKVASNP